MDSDAPNVADSRRRRLARATLLLVVMCALAALSMWMPPSGSVAAPRDHRRPGPALGELIGRNHVILIHASPDGPLYTVCRPDGATLRRHLFADEVRSAFPDIDLSKLRLDAPPPLAPDLLRGALMLVDQPNDPFR